MSFGQSRRAPAQAGRAQELTPLRRLMRAMRGVGEIPHLDLSVPGGMERYLAQAQWGRGEVAATPAPEAALSGTPDHLTGAQGDAPHAGLEAGHTEVCAAAHQVADVTAQIASDLARHPAAPSQPAEEGEWADLPWEDLEPVAEVAAPASADSSAAEARTLQGAVISAGLIAQLTQGVHWQGQLWRLQPVTSEPVQEAQTAPAPEGAPAAPLAPKKAPSPPARSSTSW